MATNKVQPGEVLRLYVGTGKEAGDPVAVGAHRGVCLTDADSTGYAQVDTTGVWDLSVTPQDQDGASAVSVGDKLYYHSGDGSIDKNGKTGVLIGTANEAIAASPLEAATINVKLAGGVGLDQVKGVILAAGNAETTEGETSVEVEISGVVATDVVNAGFRVNGNSPTLNVVSAIASEDTITVTVDGTFADGDEISYLVIRPA